MRGIMRPIILLTGFGPFPSIDSNATAELVPELARHARARFPAHQIRSAILPVEWERAPQMLQELLSAEPAALALHFGVARAASGFQIELVGRNVCEGRHDAKGELPACEHVIAAGPAILASTLPVERIIARLTRAGVPCCTSNNAGGYLCNALLYHSLSLANAHPAPFLTGFVHLPSGLARCPTACAADGCRLTWETALDGSLEIIAACLEAPGLAPA
jgi:pyroglutamyl-peptidase